MFTSPNDIGARVCQHIGATRISTLADNSKAANEINACYDKLRQAELQSHVWRFAVRSAGLRPITSTIKLLSFPAYASGTTYQQGDIVNDTTANAGNSGQALYVSLKASNTGNTPSSAKQQDGTWTPYFGPDVADAYSSSNTYSAGELAYVTTSIYLSAANANVGNAPASGAPWTAAALTSVTGATLFIPFPLTQVNSGVSRTAYRLPFGYLRVAPQDPKIAGGSYQTVGAGMQYSDFQFIGNYLLTASAGLTGVANGPLIFRFCADISDVSQMEPVFCETLAVRIAYDICETVTQNRQLKTQLAGRYDQLIMEARRDNMLEQGSTDPKEQDFMLSRVVGNPDQPIGQGGGRQQQG